MTAVLKVIRWRIEYVYYVDRYNSVLTAGFFKLLESIAYGKKKVILKS